MTPPTTKPRAATRTPPFWIQPPEETTQPQPIIAPNAMTRMSHALNTLLNSDCFFSMMLCPPQLLNTLHATSSMSDAVPSGPSRLLSMSISRLIAHGIDVVTVANILGHSQVSTTDNIYAHIIEAERTKASECLAYFILRTKQS